MPQPHMPYRRPSEADPALVERLKVFILGFRRAGGPAARTMEAALAAFPTANSPDVALALMAANRAERAAWEAAK